MRLQGRAAVVTGSTGGLGEGIARRLAAEGAAVVISGRRTEPGERVAQSLRECGARAVFIRADVADESECTGLIRGAVEQLGRLDILVNNAAITPAEPPDRLSVEVWDQAFAINARGAFLCAREAIPVMRRQGGGRIINIGTSVPFRGRMERLASDEAAHVTGGELNITGGLWI